MLQKALLLMDVVILVKEIIIINFRQNLVDEFTCEGHSYGYYADVANECQEISSVIIIIIDG